MISRKINLCGFCVFALIFCDPLMAQGSRPARVADQMRMEITRLLAREVHDPGIGFLTVTHVQVTPDLQRARVYYTVIGDSKARGDTERALRRAVPFLRRQIGQRLRLRRVPEIEFHYDESIAQQDRVEQLLKDIHDQATSTPPPDTDADTDDK